MKCSSVAYLTETFYLNIYLSFDVIFASFSSARFVDFLLKYLLLVPASNSRFLLKSNAFIGIWK